MLLSAVQVLHKAQLEDRKLLTSQCGQVDDMYESLAAHEQKVPTTDQVKHDDLKEALATFQNQLTQVKGLFACRVVPSWGAQTVLSGHPWCQQALQAGNGTQGVRQLNQPG